MSAVEVPPCSLENESNPFEINVKIIHRIQPVIFDRKQCEEFENLSAKLHKERQVRSQSETCDEEYINGIENANHVCISEDYKPACGFPTEDTDPQGESKDDETLTKDSNKLANKKKESFEQKDEYVVLSGDEQIANGMQNEKDACLMNDSGCQPTDYLDHPLDAVLDTITKNANKNRNQETTNKSTEDNVYEQNLNSPEKCETEKSALGSCTLTASREQEMEHCKVLDSLRAEYVTKIWDDYVSDFLIASGQMTQAAILDSETGIMLAGSVGFNIQDSEFQQILLGIQYQEAAYRYGVTVNGCHYKVRLADGRHGIFAKSEMGGCSVCKTNTLVIIGVHDKSCSPRHCNEEVMRLGDFFTQKGM
ncbi:uncharacterized protein LOC121376106 [Gigantopelta aegis]|uniref:uncharacterized protein LOC121376106 n=1 Tax=Gigantopelta aegis TaxID=1735272 RepID=UPI001B88A050|nr:uncharacterized protein LOC121376106 [Gigantopelta aegis]